MAQDNTDSAQTALDLLLSTLEQIGTPVAAEAAKSLTDLAGNKTGWQALALNLAAQGVAEHGAQGIDMALQQIKDIVDKRTVTIDMGDPRTSHLLVAALEHETDLHRHAVADFFTKVGQALAQVGLALTAGLLKGVFPVA